MRNMRRNRTIYTIEKHFKKYGENRPLLQRIGPLDTTKGEGCCAGWSAVLAQAWQDIETVEDFEDTILNTPRAQLLHDYNPFNKNNILARRSKRGLDS